MEKADFGIDQNWAIWARLSKKFPYAVLGPELGPTHWWSARCAFPNLLLYHTLLYLSIGFQKKILSKYKKSRGRKSSGFLYRLMNIYTAPKELGSSSSM